MLFNELNEKDKERYIISTLEKAIEISHFLPSPIPRSFEGIYSYIKENEITDTIRKNFTTDEMNKFSIVFLKWRLKFFVNDVETWKSVWVIFDERIYLRKKEKILGIKKSYIYKKRNQIIEIFKRFLEQENKECYI